MARRARMLVSFAALTALVLTSAGSNADGNVAGPMRRRPYEALLADSEELDRLRVPLDGRPSSGPSDALVTIVAFVDFECPFSARVQATLRELRAQEGGAIRIVVRNYPLPFHASARLAAEASLEAFAQRGNGGFADFHDRLFAHQHDLRREDLERYAAESGLDVGRFRLALDSHTHAAAIDRDLAEVARLGVDGTPAFFVNGRPLVGSLPLETFQELVRSERRIAEQLVARGVSRLRLYETIAMYGRERPRPRPEAAPTPAGPRPGAPDPGATYRVEIPERSPARGAAQPLVTLVAITDFECPFSARVQATLAELLRRQPNDLGVVYLHNPLPFHRNAMDAAVAAREAYEQGGDALYLRVHDVFFEHGAELNRDRIIELASDVGADGSRVRAALEARTHVPRIESEQALARRFGGNGTPSFFINGRFLSGAQAIERFQALIDEELARARTLMARGVARAAIYRRTIEGGLAEVPPAPAAPPVAATPDPDPDTVFELAVPTDALMLGAAAAPITVQVFHDYQCPFSRRLWGMIPQLEERFRGRVRFVFRDYPLPFHPLAPRAARAVREVRRQLGPRAALRYHGVVYERAPDFEGDVLLDLARPLGRIDVAAFRRALENGYEAEISRDMRAIADAGIPRFGTPTSFVNGRLVAGAVPIEQFVEAIERALGTR